MRKNYDTNVNCSGVEHKYSFNIYIRINIKNFNTEASIDLISDCNNIYYPRLIYFITRLHTTEL